MLVSIYLGSSSVEGEVQRQVLRPMLPWSGGFLSREPQLEEVTEFLTVWGSSLTALSQVCIITNCVTANTFPSFLEMFWSWGSVGRWMNESSVGAAKYGFLSCSPIGLPQLAISHHCLVILKEEASRSWKGWETRAFHTAPKEFSPDTPWCWLGESQLD